MTCNAQTPCTSCTHADCRIYEVVKTMAGKFGATVILVVEDGETILITKCGRLEKNNGNHK